MKTISVSPPTRESTTHQKILSAAKRLFARKGYDSTTTREIAQSAGVAEGTLFRHFDNKKAVLIEVATAGWIDILTELLTELCEMGSYKAVAQMMRRRMLHLRDNHDLFRVCFLEAQFHPELREKIQTDVIAKMTDVAEAFVQTGIDRGVYRPLDPRLIAHVFLGLFMVAGFSHDTLQADEMSPEAMKDMAEGLADIFLNGVLVRET
ncbi:MAG: TetR/AcrR family transcriptional regulator [Coleofasciculaceae cyanobacterium RL_1_1]|nr:TetR/AcrR family transcriptional regulator [Coleofasciculaceae cyanobacterium RL_1_1]